MYANEGKCINRHLPIFNKHSLSIHVQSEEAITREVKKEPKSAPPVPQVSKPKPGGRGGLFSDDSEEGGSLFGSPPKPKAESETRTKSKPKATVSLFDDDAQDAEEDFFAAHRAKAKRFVSVARNNPVIHPWLSPVWMILCAQL